MRLTFVDEKSLKGAEILNCRARADALTGFVPITVADSDFRNTYCMTGFDNNKPAICYSIAKETNDAMDFFMSMLTTVGQGYCNRGDVIVMDNAAIHVLVVENFTCCKYVDCLLFISS